MMPEIKQTTKNFDWQLIFILVVAAILRFYLLDLRPPHHDEGVNGWFADQVTTSGFYRYDPNNYHGPLNFYILFLFQTLLGHNIWALRLPTVIISLMTIYWISLFAPFVGRTTVLITAIAIALSPANIYFARFLNIDYFLVFFQIVILWGIIGLWNEGAKKYLWAIVLGISGMILTKETYIIHVCCFILAWLCLTYLEKYLPTKQIECAKQMWTQNDLILISSVGIGIIILFYSGFSLNLQGVYGLYETYAVWFKTGVKSGGHAKPFIHWINIFMWYEQIGLIGVIGCIRCFQISHKWLRYIAIYGLGTLLAYSIIPYKTPWLIINLLWPFYFVFGDTLSRFLETRFKFLVISAFTFLCVLSTAIAIKLSFIDYANHKEPYVYVQTFDGIKKLTDPLFKLVKKDPTQYSLVGNILRDDEWPLPWVLADFPRVGYYNRQSLPSVYDADFLFVESSRIEQVEENLKNQYFTETFQLRDAQDPSKLYLSYEKFNDIFPGRLPEFTPQKPEPIIPGQGLLALFYPNTNWSGSPVIKKAVGKVDFYWEYGKNSAPLPPPFSVEFIGDINIHPDTTLALYTDDGGFLEINGARIIDDPGPHGVLGMSVQVLTPPGWQKIRTGFYDLGGGAIIRLVKESLNKTELTIPPSDLRYNERLLK